VYTHLTPGSYTIQIKDKADIEVAYESNPIVITEPDEIDYTIRATNPLCFETNTGTIEFRDEEGGAGAFSYSIDEGETYSDNPLFENLDAGSYIAQVVDENGCLMVNSHNPVELTDPDLFAIGGINLIDNTACDGAGNGSIEILDNSGSLDSPPLKSTTSTTLHYYFSIDDGSTWHQDTSLFENLVGGTYQVWAKNPNGCEAEYESNPVVLSTNNISISWVSATNITHCDSVDNGTITVTASGEGDLQYSIDNGETWSDNNAFTNLAVGSYTVVVKNRYDCTKEYSHNPVVIEDYRLPVIDRVMSRGVLCYGINNGEINIESFGSEGGGIAIGGYSIDSMHTWQTGSLFEDLSGDDYYVFIKDINGCTSGYESNPIVFDTPTEIIISEVVSTNPSGAVLGTIDIVATGGEEPLNYSINDGEDFYAESSFNDLVAGSYTIIVEDNNGCDVMYEANPIVLTGILDDEEILDISYYDGDTTCVGAYQTITIGGDGNDVYFNIGSSTSLIAGSSITFLPGVHIYEGAYLTATITTDSSFCDVVEASGSPVIEVEKTEKSKEESEIHKDAGDALLMQSLKVFPNPNNGNFQIEIETTEVLVDFIISNSLGSKVYSGKLAKGATHLNLTTLSKGIYFIRTTNTRTPITRKMVVR